MEDVETSNFQFFRVCLSTSLIEKSTEIPPKSIRARSKAGRKTAVKPVIAENTETDDADELAEFIEV